MMNENYGKSDMGLINVEAYAMPSSTYVENDSHCFVVTEDKGTCWYNHGGGWSDFRQKTLVAKNQAYKEWLWEFVPPSSYDKCGIKFGVNGVCHTYANRELLVGRDDVSAEQAAKDYVCVFFFGKYGFGLNRLKQLLSDSYQKVTSSYHDPYNALNTVLQRVDNYLDDELKAWRKVGIEYTSIPIDEILAKNPQGGIITARRRLRQLVAAREAIYQQYLDNKITGDEVKSKVKDLIQRSSDDYLSMLASINYISQRDKETYSANIARFLGRFRNALIAQEETLQLTGVLNLNFLSSC